MSEVYLGDAVRKLLIRDCDGVKTIDDLKARCFVDEDTECWHWKLSRMEDGRPKVNVRVRGKRESIHGRRAAFILSRGYLPERGHRVFAVDACKSIDCVNPRHCRSGTVAEHGAAQTKRGNLKNVPSKVRANREIARKHTAHLTMEQARQIRTADGSLLQVAKRFGVTARTVWAIKKNIRYKESVDVMPTADVFAWAQNQHMREAA